MIMITNTLIALLLASALCICFTPSLFAIAMLMGVYSFILALLMSVWGGLDVAFTEAVVSSGVGTILIITLIWSTSHRIKKGPFKLRDYAITASGVALFLCGAWFLLDMPAFGSLSAAPNVHVSPFYLEEGFALTHTPNIVTAVLADFRSFDTLMETVVVLAAGFACWLLGSDRA